MAETASQGYFTLRVNFWGLEDLLKGILYLGMISRAVKS